MHHNQDNEQASLAPGPAAHREPTQATYICVYVICFTMAPAKVSLKINDVGLTCDKATTVVRATLCNHGNHFSSLDSWMNVLATEKP